ncbi:hypothetical protein HQ544_01575 [Candidatus Falkowbacteria bacterium]|nr:hypothetical protein [Candidatus Falkowbacteria bacterium]
MNKNQEKILNLAKRRDISKMGFRKIMRELGFNNPQTVIYHMNQLKKKGLIYFDSEKRKQRVAKPRAFLVDNLLNIPILGAANCGEALELADENIEGYLKISKKSLGSTARSNSLFAIRAVGDSLNKADINGYNIQNGDYVIVDRDKQPDNKDYVLSIIDEGANFKRFYKDEKRKEIRLVSESTLEIPPIVLHEGDLNSYMVNGVVVRVVKD